MLLLYLKCLNCQVQIQGGLLFLAAPPDFTHSLTRMLNSTKEKFLYFVHRSIDLLQFLTFGHLARLLAVYKKLNRSSFASLRPVLHCPKDTMYCIRSKASPLQWWWFC